MSSTAICASDATGAMEKCREFKNAWGSAWFIWDALWRQHVAGELTMERLQDADERDKLWELDRDTRLSVDERIVLLTTFDYCLIRRAECLRVAQALDHFVQTYERRRDWAACSLPLQALFLRDLASNPEVREVGWWQHSTEPNPWVMPIGEDDERPYNVQFDRKHWFLFDRYPELRPAPK